MSIRGILKAVRWFCVAPVRRWKFLKFRDYRQAAACMHWSADLQVAGLLDFDEAVVIGRRTRLNVPQGSLLTLKQGVWLGDDCEIGPMGAIQVGAHTSLQNRSIILGNVEIGGGGHLAPISIYLLLGITLMIYLSCRFAGKMPERRHWVFTKMADLGRLSLEMIVGSALTL